MLIFKVMIGMILKCHCRRHLCR